jgi:hypothetical protein
MYDEGEDRARRRGSPKINLQFFSKYPKMSYPQG